MKKIIILFCFVLCQQVTAQFGVEYQKGYKDGYRYASYNSNTGMYKEPMKVPYMPNNTGCYDVDCAYKRGKIDGIKAYEAITSNNTNARQPYNYGGQVPIDQGGIDAMGKAMSQLQQNRGAYNDGGYNYSNAEAIREWKAFWEKSQEKWSQKSIGVIYSSRFIAATFRYPFAKGWLSAEPSFAYNYTHSLPEFYPDEQYGSMSHENGYVTQANVVNMFLNTHLQFGVGFSLLAGAGVGYGWYYNSTQPEQQLSGFTGMPYQLGMEISIIKNKIILGGLVRRELRDSKSYLSGGLRYNFK